MGEEEVYLILMSSSKADMDELVTKLSKTMEDGLWGLISAKKDLKYQLEVINRLELLGETYSGVDTTRIVLKKADILIKQARKIKEVEIEYDAEGKKKPLPMEQSGLNEMIVDKLLNAARILLDTSLEPKRIKKLLEEAMKIDAQPNYRKYGFPELKDPKALKDYFQP